MSLSSSIFLALVVFTATCYAAPMDDSINTHSCKTFITKWDTCRAGISTSGGCQSSTINLTNTEYAQCLSNSFFWSYPMNNLTFIIETPFTQPRQGYLINFNNGQLPQETFRVFRIVNNQENEVTTLADQLIQYADANYQVILKIEAPTSMTYYGVYITYTTVEMP
jgi:hypothetical protein